MSSSPSHRQYLTPTDLTMVQDIIVQICARRAISAHGLGAQRIAAILVREFQEGATTEAELLAAFDHRRSQMDSQSARPGSAMERALERWSCNGAVPFRLTVTR